VRDTGVRFKDIAGLDHIVVEMREVVKMLLNDPAYVRVSGAVRRRGQNAQALLGVHPIGEIAVAH
jgi:ATP-dependent Zn protease